MITQVIGQYCTSLLPDEDLKGKPQENCLARCTEGLILAVEIRLCMSVLVWK